MCKIITIEQLNEDEAAAWRRQGIIRQEESCKPAVTMPTGRDFIRFWKKKLGNENHNIKKHKVLEEDQVPS